MVPGHSGERQAERHVTANLSRTKAPGFPHAGLTEFRANELAVRATGRYPFSVWQLTGAGSVGSQAMTGIPVVWALRSHPELAARSVVWPFETGLTTDPTGGRADTIVHAEIWPSAIPVDRARHPVKDAAQVIGLCEHLARSTQRGTGRTVLTGPRPRNGTSGHRRGRLDPGRASTPARRSFADVVVDDCSSV